MDFKIGNICHKFTWYQLLDLYHSNSHIKYRCYNIYQHVKHETVRPGLLLPTQHVVNQIL